MSMIGIKLLQALKNLESCGSLISVSRQLNLTLPALSHQIKKIEDYYECTLFIRKSKPIQFTEQGKILLKLAEQVLPPVQEVHEQLLSKSNESNSQSLHIALECHSCYQWLLPTLNDFRYYWPEINLNLSSEFNFHPLPKLLEGALDLVITADPDESLKLSYIPLFKFDMMIGVSIKNPLATKPYLIAEDLCDECIITYPVDFNRLSLFTKLLNPAGITAKEIRNVDLTLMILELVACNQGICCLPSWAYDEYPQKNRINMLKMGTNGVQATLYIALRPEDANKKITLEFINIAKKNSSLLLNNIRPI